MKDLSCPPFPSISHHLDDMTFLGLAIPMNLHLPLLLGRGTTQYIGNCTPDFSDEYPKSPDFWIWGTFSKAPFLVSMLNFNYLLHYKTFLYDFWGVPIKATDINWSSNPAHVVYIGNEILPSCIHYTGIVINELQGSRASPSGMEGNNTLVALVFLFSTVLTS